MFALIILYPSCYVSLAAWTEINAETYMRFDSNPSLSSPCHLRAHAAISDFEQSKVPSWSRESEGCKTPARYVTEAITQAAHILRRSRNRLGSHRLCSHVRCPWPTYVPIRKKRSKLYLTNNDEFHVA